MLIPRLLLTPGAVRAIVEEFVTRDGTDHFAVEQRIEQVVFVIDARTGEQRAAMRLGVSFTASPLVAGGDLYACDEDGTTTVVRATVVRATVPPEIVAKNRLREGMRASPAVADGAIYLRTYHSLYKIAETATK